MIVLVLISLLAGPVWSNLDEDEHLETVLAVTQCRASCLDQVGNRIFIICHFSKLLFKKDLFLNYIIEVFFQSKSPY